MSVIATLTADNHYGLYAGNATGSELRFVGRNEKGELGNPGIHNWSLPETWTFSVNKGEYLYLVAWDTGDQQMWIGDFRFDSYGFVSDVSSWLYVLPESDRALAREADIPVALADLSPIIEGAQWRKPREQYDNGTGPWRTIEGIDSAAQFLWHDTGFGDSASEGSFVVFRSASPLPEPHALSLIASVVLVVGLRNRSAMAGFAHGSGGTVPSRHRRRL